MYKRKIASLLICVFQKIMLPLYSEELFDSNEPQNIEIRTAAKSLP